MARHERLGNECARVEVGVFGLSNVQSYLEGILDICACYCIHLTTGAG